MFVRVVNFGLTGWNELITAERKKSCSACCWEKKQRQFSRFWVKKLVRDGWCWCWCCLWGWSRNMIKQAGGEEAWALLSPDQRRDLSAKWSNKFWSLWVNQNTLLWQRTAQRAGLLCLGWMWVSQKYQYSAGAMHAVINGGGKNDLPGPVLLATRTIQHFTHLGSWCEPTAAYEHALQSSTRGGIKATDMQVLFPDKDHKKANRILQSCGLNSLEIHLLFLAHPTIAMLTLCCSWCLLLHLTSSSKFLEFIRDKKKTCTFNNMRIIFTMH